MKRILIIVLSLFFIVCFSYVPVCATSEPYDLKEVADRVIDIEQTIDNDACITVYSNLDVFVEEAYMQFPQINNIQLAQFLSDYTEQEIDVHTEDMAMFLLKLNNIHTTCQLFPVNKDNREIISPPINGLRDTWNSSDNYMKIVTSYSYQFHDSLGDHYKVWATATWKVMPGILLEDVFVLGSSATFDDSYVENGYCSLTYRCDEPTCLASSLFYRNVNKNSTSNNGLKLQYSSGYPYIRFNVIGGYCKTCYSSNTHLEKYSAFDAYQVIANGTEMIYACYGHKTLGLSGLTVSISSAGVVSIGGLAIVHTDYAARGVTLSH